MPLLPIYDAGDGLIHEQLTIIYLLLMIELKVELKIELKLAHFIDRDSDFIPDQWVEGGFWLCS